MLCIVNSKGNTKGTTVISQIVETVNPNRGRRRGGKKETKNTWEK